MLLRHQLLGLATVLPAFPATSDLQTHATCVSAISGGGVLNDTVATVAGHCTGHDTTDQSFICGGEGNMVELKHQLLGFADFTLSAALLLETVGDTAASIQLFTCNPQQDSVGIDGNPAGAAPHPSTFFLAGPHFDPATFPPVSAPPAKQWVNITVARTSGRLMVKLNGKQLFIAPANFTINGVALRPWRSTMRIKSFMVCAEHLPAIGALPCPAPIPPDPRHLVKHRKPLFKGGFANYSMFRIPALLVIPATHAKTTADIVLAFAEARGPNHQSACDSCNTRIAMLRSTDAGQTFSETLQEVTSATPTDHEKDWTGNAVPLFDDGSKTGNPPTVTLVYSHNNQYVLYKRSTDFGQSWGSAVNISEAAHPSGTSWAVNCQFTGPGGGIQLRHGPKAGRLLVPAIAIYNVSAAPPGSCTIGSACWSSASRDHTMFSDDGGALDA